VTTENAIAISLLVLPCALVERALRESRERLHQPAKARTARSVFIKCASFFGPRAVMNGGEASRSVTDPHPVKVRKFTLAKLAYSNIYVNESLLAAVDAQPERGR
jgi:hypothetical protein